MCGDIFIFHPIIHWTGGWMVRKADLYVMVQKIRVYRELNLGHPVCSHSIY
jgi:hypothetical protein